MAMDFWEAHRRARLRTTLYVAVFILLTIGVACIAEWAMRYFSEGQYNPPMPYIGMIFIGITTSVAVFQYLMFCSQGGSYVAESMGAIYLDPEYASPKEQQLLNIVAEMALAASVPIPAVYLIKAKEINAFAAGTKPENAVVAITIGSLNVLTRDEIQGVIAHELGHIHNRDMVLSMRMAAMVMGFFFVLYLALRIFQFSPMRSSDEDRKGPNLVALAALILFIAGIFTWFAGSILKCTVSRQREYLADASAVQFTRNPAGIANALRKIGQEKTHDMPASGIAYSHMYLEDTSFMSGLFATHPPLAKRIAAIENRTYTEDTTP